MIISANCCLSLLLVKIGVVLSVNIHTDYFGAARKGNNSASDGFSALSKIQCAAFCSKSETCTSFSYKKDKKLCFHSRGLLDPAVTSYPVYVNKDHQTPPRLGEAVTGIAEPETEPKTCPFYYSLRTVGGMDRCLRKYTDKQMYSGAAKTCFASNGHLYTMRDQEDINQIVYTYGFQEAWIDGNMNGTRMNGDPLPWTSWKETYPKTGECACLINNVAFIRMETRNCADFFGFVCQVDL